MFTPSVQHDTLLVELTAFLASSVPEEVGRVLLCVRVSAYIPTSMLDSQTSDAQFDTIV